MHVDVWKCNRFIIKLPGLTQSTRGCKSTTVSSGLYLCHRVFLSTPVDSDTLQWRGDMKPRAHTDNSPHSRHQTGLVHMLSREGAKLEVINNKNTQYCQSNSFPQCSISHEVKVSAGSLVLLQFCRRDSLAHLSHSALRPSRLCSCTVRTVCHTGRRSHIDTAAGSPPRTGPPHTLCKHTAACTSRKTHMRQDKRETKQRRRDVNYIWQGNLRCHIFAEGCSMFFFFQ